MFPAVSPPCLWLPGVRRSASPVRFDGPAIRGEVAWRRLLFEAWLRMRMLGLSFEPSSARRRSSAASTGCWNSFLKVAMGSRWVLDEFNLSQIIYRSPFVSSNGVNTPYHLRVIRAYVHFVISIISFYCGARPRLQWRFNDVTRTFGRYPFNQNEKTRTHCSLTHKTNYGSPGGGSCGLP